MFEISVNGEAFTLWETAQLDRTIDNNAGKFRFTCSNAAPDVLPVRAGDAVQILVNDVPRLTGFVDTLSAAQQGEHHTVTVEGRDNIADLIDSSVPDAAKAFDGPISLQLLCERVVSALGADIPVVSDVSGIADFGENEVIAAESGQRCMDFLTSFARKRQVYVVAGGDGSLRIFRPTGTRASSPIVHIRGGDENNVIAYSVRYMHQNLFNRYVVRSQDNFGFDDDADYLGDGVSRTGDVVDNRIRSSRYLEIQAEQTMDDEETGARANEEANIRRARSIEYKATLQGVAQSDGTLWDFGQLVPVRDQFAGITGIFLVRAISMSADIESGTKTVLTLAPPDAYQVRGQYSLADSRRADLGDILQVIVPDNRERFVR